MGNIKLKILFATILIVILALFVNGLFLAYKKTPPEKPSPSPSFNPVVLGKKTENQKINFEAYTNSYDGYSLNYPSTWQTDTEETAFLISYSDLEGTIDIIFQKIANPGSLSPKQFAISDNTEGNSQSFKDEIINIQGLEGYKLENSNKTTIYFPLYGNILKISSVVKGKNKEELKKIFNQIIASFKLLEKSSITSVTGWKTYANKDMQISFSYPSNFIPDTTDYTKDKKILYLKRIEAPNPFYQIDIQLLENFEKSGSEMLAMTEIDKYPPLKPKITQETIEINGVNAVKVIGLPGKFQKIDIFVGVKDREYIISLNPYDPILFPTFYPEATTLFYQFLSTIKFQ